LPYPILMLVSTVVALAGVTVPASAHEAGSTGGAAALEGLELEQAVCATGEQWTCAPGTELTLQGEALDGVRRVQFLGRAGRGDDRSVRPSSARMHAVRVAVPSGARSGPVAVVARGGRRARTSRWLRIAPTAAETRDATPAPVATGQAFPIAGRFRWGTATNHFGGGRGHQGEDVFAECGTPLVALADATVQFRADGHARAGNYLVLQTEDEQSFTYMHLQAPALVVRGDRVRAGQRIGAVGDTGNANGCHLHFEQWTAPGWYEGGHAVDPLPLLRRLQR
jgi:hypothetical protein